MGRAVVIESLGYGHYVVDIIRDSPEIRAFVEVQFAAAQIVADTLPDLLAASNVAETEMEAARQKYEADQSVLEPDRISPFLQGYLRAFAAYETDRSIYLTSKMRVLELESRAAAKLETLAVRRADVWCATYTSIPVGTEVGTIEVGRQGSDIPYTVIAPLGRAPVADDGVLRDVMSMTPAQAFLNYALVPGATQWRRLYSRASVIETDIDGVQLYVAIHTFNSAGIYIHCDPAILWLPYIRRCPLEGYCEYKVGDHVLIEHHPETHEPVQVIGWSEWPRPCLGNYLKTLTLTESITPRRLSAPPQSEWPDGYNCDQATAIRVGRIDAPDVDLMHGYNWDKSPQPDDGKNYDYYMRADHYNGVFSYYPPVLTEAQQQSWDSAYHDFPHWREAIIHGETIRYSYAPWGEDDRTVVAAPEVSIIIPTDFTTIERFFGDGEIRSIRGEFGGYDTLAMQRGEITGAEAIYDIDLGNNLVVLTSDYSIGKMCDHITNIQIASGTNGNTTDPDYPDWESLVEGLISRVVVMAVSHIYCQAEFSWPGRGYALKLEVKLFKAAEQI
ncbi:MAG: hypothetical protein QM483_09985 [Desulfuromusa sp.]